jgi:hypothetical protein
MDKIMAVIQFVLACLMLACVIVGVAAHIIAGNLSSIMNFAVALFIIYLTLAITKIAYREMREMLKK